MKCARFAIAAGIMLFIAGCSGSSSSVAPSSPDEILDFKNNTANFVGKTLAMKFTYSGQPVSGKDLAEGTWNIPFRVQGAATDGSPYDYFITISIPRGMYSGSLDDGDAVSIEFECAEGNLEQGNTALSIH